MLVIGSYALRHFNIDIGREPSDYDIMCSISEYNWFLKEAKKTDRYITDYRLKNKNIIHMIGKKPYEFELYVDKESQNMTAYQLNDLVTKNGYYSKNALENKLQDSVNNVKFVFPCIVYALKMSHRFLRNSPHFLKTMNDIYLLRREGWGFIPDFLIDWMKKREKVTYDYSHPSLNQTKKDFFNDDIIKYIYDHDSIHEAIKHLDKPAYSYMKEDEAEVKCSKEKFDNLPYIFKIAAVLEEAYVLALERHQIPNDFKPNPTKSFEIALMKICTSITSGWFREWAYEHYYEILEYYDDGEYVDKFKNGLSSGLVKPFK